MKSFQQFRESRPELTTGPHRSAEVDFNSQVNRLVFGMMSLSEKMRFYQELNKTGMLKYLAPNFQEEARRLLGAFDRD